MEFNPARFEALVLYIAHRRRDDERFGRTKLAKALFYSDFENYKLTEQPITGARYIRMPFGPLPEPLEQAEAHLAELGYVYPDYLKEEYEEKKLRPLKAFPLEWASLFVEGQLDLADQWADQIASASARRITELSHDHPGWLLAREVGVEIPYHTAILPLERPSPVQAEMAKEVARERGWLSADGQWTWERNRA